MRRHILTAIGGIILAACVIGALAQQGVPPGGYNQNGGSGGGGGTPGGSNLQFQFNNMGAFSGSAFSYEASGNAVCPVDPALYSVHMSEGTVCVSPDEVSIFNTDDDHTSAVMQDDDFVATDATNGANTKVFKNRIGLQDATVADTVAILNSGEIDLGQNGDVPGLLRLNGAVTGSGTIGITDDAAYVTINPSIVVGTTTLTPPTFPFTSIEPGEIFENDSSGNETVDLLNTGSLVLGNSMGAEGGSITLNGATSGAAIITVQAAAGTPTLTLGTSSGTPAVTASAPLAIDATTGNVSITGSLTPIQTCGTTTTCSHTVLTTPQVVMGSAALVTGTPSTATITGITPAFTSASSYVCTLGAQSSATGALLSVANVTGSSFTITGPAAVTTVINYICAGN